MYALSTVIANVPTKKLHICEDVELKAKNKQKLSLKSFQKAPKLQLLHKNLKIFGDAYMP